VCDLDVMGAPFKLSVIRKAASLARTRPTLLSWQGQLPLLFYFICSRIKKGRSPRVVVYFFVYYESIKREIKIRCIYECRCDERLQTKTKAFTHLTYTGLVVELEHLKIETTLIDEKFANTMGEYVT
jgi:hypothetical protein